VGHGTIPSNTNARLDESSRALIGENRTRADQKPKRALNCAARG
jgi:hypothetical protein